MDQRPRPHQGPTAQGPPWTSAYPPPQSASNSGPIGYIPAESVRPYVIPHHGIGPSVSSDHRAYQHEIARLKQLLAAARAGCARHAEAVQREAEISTQKHVAKLREQIVSLEAELTEARQAEETRNTHHKKELSVFRARWEASKKECIALSTQGESLKRELQNVAIAAAAEQQELGAQHSAAAHLLQSQLSEKTETALALRKELATTKTIQEDWKRAHRHAVTLGEFLGQCFRSERQAYAEVCDEYDRFRREAAGAFDLYDEEIETLEALVSGLRTDHEAVELINDDLDQLVDRLEAENKDLARGLRDATVKSRRDRQESLRAVDTLGEQLQMANARLIAVSAERKSLVESVAKLKTIADEYDASMFAKDQEINATKRVAEESQQQLDQLRREQSCLAGQNEEMRNRMRDMSTQISQLKEELAESSEQLETAQSRAEQQDRQLREIQSAARAAEANAILHSSEAEKEYLAEIDELQTELEQLQESANRHTEKMSLVQTKLDDSQSDLARAKQASAISAAENDRLQQTVDQQSVQVGELESKLDAKSNRIGLLEESLQEAAAEGRETAQEVDRLRGELESSREKLAEYADRVARQQLELAQTRDATDATDSEASSESVERTAETRERREEIEAEVAEKFQSRISELERSQLTIRERYIQSQHANEQTIESLRSNIEALVDERDALTAISENLGSRVSGLQRKLDAYAEPDEPVKEARRLSEALSRQIALHANEREGLLRRIEQLHESRRLGRAA